MLLEGWVVAVKPTEMGAWLVFPLDTHTPAAIALLFAVLEVLHFEYVINALIGLLLVLLTFALLLDVTLAVLLLTLVDFLNDQLYSFLLNDFVAAHLNSILLLQDAFTIRFAFSRRDFLILRGRLRSQLLFVE